MKTILALIGLLSVLSCAGLVLLVACREAAHQWRRRHLTTALSRLESEWEPVLDERRDRFAGAWRKN